MDPRTEGVPEPPGWVASAEDHDSAARPLLPGADPFYQPPPGYHATKPGTVLRARQVQLAFLGRIPQRLHATQLLYRTTDLNDNPSSTVTTVLTPPGYDPQEPCPVLSYQCAIDAVAGRCFPSYALRRGANAAGALAQFELLLIAGALTEGWAVSIPDHGGPLGLFGAPLEPGYCVLDGLRAAVNYAPLQLSATAPVGLWGYSGGGLACAWAAEMYDSYAPELNIVGAVLGSPVGDLGSTYRRLNGRFFSALPTLVVAALMQSYPDLRRVIEQHASAEGKDLFEKLGRMTTARAVMRLRKHDMAEMLDRPLQEVLDTPEVQHVLESIKLGVSAPSMPVLVVQAANDRIISVEDIDRLVETYTEGGTDVTYHRDKFGEHILLHPFSAPMALRWLGDRFAGVPTSDRDRSTWPVVLSPSTYRGLARLARVSARVVTGRSVRRRVRAKPPTGSRPRTGKGAR